MLHLKTNKRLLSALVLVLVAVSIAILFIGFKGQTSHVSTNVSSPISTKTEDYKDFSLTYPADWTYKEGTDNYGIYNNFIGPKGPSGYEPSILISRSVNADAQTLADVITLFQTIHNDRRLQPVESIKVKGAIAANKIRSTRTYKGTEITAWNVILLTPSKTSLNIEFAAPTIEFNASFENQLLASLVVK